MNGYKILYPTDFSTAGHTALEMATSLARDRSATLIIMHVEEPPMAYGGGELYYGMEEPDRNELKRMLSEVVPTDSAVAFEHRLMVGSPAAAILEMAESPAGEPDRNVHSWADWFAASADGECGGGGCAEGKMPGPDGEGGGGGESGGVS